MTTFVLPHVENPLFIAFNALLLATIALLSSMVWSGFGSLFRKLFQDHYRLVNTILALLLVYCAWTLYH
ncbi:Cysteine/O-acetylserine efflux protein [bioreactor metagenome]|uniref:Cysteine/O-acetylserine efflux protein n=2 Tax=root TaxID=1 RepID=A0A645HL92_9ZZZZ